MHKGERDNKTAGKSANSDKRDSLKAAHQRDESAQTRDIERMSDKSPDEAEAGMTEKERDAHRMRTKNEV